MGLSPRMRGNLAAHGVQARGAGSIPAHAGEPGRARRAGSWCWVYPRACGGTWPRTACRLVVLGLSPRMRGNLAAHGVNPGGTPGINDDPLAYRGLSPRMRGNQQPHNRSPCWRGSIPAHAGEPHVIGVRDPRARVYPRACGGTILQAFAAAREEGLSPRMRGNHQRAGIGLVLRGSIPAHAGEP